MPPPALASSKPKTKNTTRHPSPEEQYALSQEIFADDVFDLEYLIRTDEEEIRKATRIWYKRALLTYFKLEDMPDNRLISEYLEVVPLSHGAPRKCIYPEYFVQWVSYNFGRKKYPAFWIDPEIFFFLLSLV